MSDDLGTGPDMPAMLSKPHDMAQAMFQKTGEASRAVKAVGGLLAGLSKLGDLITVEDVIKGVGKLVAGGTHGAQEMASTLADMPAGGGQALAAWVQQHYQQNQQAVAGMTKMHAMARHELGVSALRLLAAHALPGAQGGPPGAAGPQAAAVQQSNPLLGGTAPLAGKA